MSPLPQISNFHVFSAPTPGIISEVAFSKTESDICFAESCNMIGIAGANAAF
jgi:hypothetical protein